MQRVAIVLHEKGLAFERRTIDLAHKPDWFLALSPLGKTPVLQVRGQSLFESAVICEYLDEVATPALHPQDAAASPPRVDGVWLCGAGQHRRVLLGARQAYVAGPCA